MRRTTPLTVGLLAAGTLAACSCEETGVQQLVPRIETEPAVLDLGDVPVGVLAQGVFTLRNAGTGVLEVHRMQVVGNPVFVVTTTRTMVLPPHGSEPVVIQARPPAVGQMEATLSISSNDPTSDPHSVLLLIRGVEPPPCDDGNVCTEDWFDTDIAQCRHRFDDGRSCQPADRCIVDAICSQGVCLGASKVCRDDSVCTRDLCRQLDGECRFIEDPGACDDSNPCTADSCDSSGCVNEALPSGSRCDDGDSCTSGDSCFAGVCTGAGIPNGSECDDSDSCTEGDVCLDGVCGGHSVLSQRAEGEVVFEYPLAVWDGAFLHRREVSLTDDGILIGMDHLPLFDPPGLTHQIFTMKQCGTREFEFAYRPPDAHVFVSFVRREMQLQPDNTLRLVVGIRQTRDQGFLPQTTTYVIDGAGNVKLSRIQTLGGETGRALLPDGSHIFALVWPLSPDPVPENQDPSQNLIVVREDLNGDVLWRHERTSGLWAEFLGVAGPRVLYWANDSWGALDFNTGQVVWQSPTPFISDTMALSTDLNLGLARVGVTFALGVPVPTQVIGVEILEGRQVFAFPATENADYIPRTDPVIAADGRIILLMQRSDFVSEQQRLIGLEYVELAPDGTVLAQVPLEYTFPPEGDWIGTRSRDFGDDPYPTVADDGVTYVGYGDRFWAIDPGGRVRWTLTSTMPDAFTATVPLLRDDGLLVINEGSRKMLGIRTNGGKMSERGWASFRHDSRRTNYTP
ncbi:MAG: choice-of-anchor D domain-containing protein [Deltaproteobacteria bacterium]|nr:choice-of-anchor D domain-containing protein [Deltaproteobacteria bacterium]